jgi:hypothetical protein
MARRPGSSGLSLHPACPHGHFPLPSPLVLAILPPLTGNAGDYTDNVSHYHYQAPWLRRKYRSAEMWEDGYAARTVGDQVTTDLIRCDIRRHADGQATNQPELF